MKYVSMGLKCERGTYIVVGQQFRPSNDQIGIITLLGQERFSNEICDIVCSDETDLAIRACCDDLVVLFNAVEVHS